MRTQQQIEMMQQLIAALRSRTYQQGAMQLRTETGYCCLGVACDVYHRATGRGMWQRGDFGGWLFLADGVDSRTYLPPAVQQAFGFHSINPYPDNKGTRHDAEGPLSRLNDTRVSFSEIADLLEQHLETVGIDVGGSGETPSRYPPLVLMPI